MDGVCVRSASHERAVQLIKAAGNQVTLTVQSLVAWVSLQNIANMFVVVTYESYDAKYTEQKSRASKIITLIFVRDFKGYF